MSSFNPSISARNSRAHNQLQNHYKPSLFQISGEPSADLMEFDKDVEGLGGISLRLVGSEDVDLVGTSFSLALNSDDQSTEQLLNNNNKRPHDVISLDDQSVNAKKKLKSSLSAGCVTNSSSNNNVIVKPFKPPALLSPQLMHERQEVERICVDLLRRFQHACAVHPKTQAKVWMAKSAGKNFFFTSERGALAVVFL